MLNFNHPGVKRDMQLLAVLFFQNPGFMPKYRNFEKQSQTSETLKIPGFLSNMEMLKSGPCLGNKCFNFDPLE